MSFFYFSVAFLVGKDCRAVTGGFKLASPELAGYSEAGIAVQELCNSNKSSFEILKSSSVKDLLPLGFNQSLLNIESIIESKVESLNASSPFQLELKKSLYANATYRTIFNSLFDFTTLMSSLDAYRGSMDNPLIETTITLLQTDLSFTIANVNGTGDKSEFLNFYNSRVQFHIDQINSLLNVQQSYDQLKTNASGVVSSIQLFKNDLIALKTSMDQNVAMYSTKLSEYEASTIGLYANLRIELIAYLKAELFEQFTSAFKSTNCPTVNQAVSAMTNSLCDTAMYFIFM